MKIILVNYFVLWVNILLIMICIQGQRYRHHGELVEAHSMSLSGHVQHPISSKQEINSDYTMVDELPTISRGFSPRIRIISFFNVMKIHGEKTTHARRYRVCSAVLTI